jgi:hypothetical protein
LPKVDWVCYSRSIFSTDRPTRRVFESTHKVYQRMSYGVQDPGCITAVASLARTTLQRWYTHFHPVTSHDYTTMTTFTRPPNTLTSTATTTHKTEQQPLDPPFTDIWSQQQQQQLATSCNSTHVTQYMVRSHISLHPSGQPRRKFLLCPLRTAYYEHIR